MKPKILLTRRIFPEIVAQLSQQFELDHNESDHILNAETLRVRAQGCLGVVACLTEKIDAAFFDACPSVKVVSNIAAGYNNIDIAEAGKRGVMVTNTPGVLDDTTADLTFALLMAAARRITESERRLRLGEWKKGFALQQWLGTDIHHASLGIIGMGRIGQTIARRALGFDMQVLYHNRTQLDPATEAVAGRISLGSAADIDKAVAAARKAFASWSETTAAQRLDLLLVIQAEYAKRQDELGVAIREEMGAPASLAGGFQGPDQPVTHIDFTHPYTQSLRVALIEASPSGYKLKGSFKPEFVGGKPCWAHPVVIGGRLYLRDQDKLMCYDVRG